MDTITLLYLGVAFGFGVVVGCIIMTILLIFVVKEGTEMLPGHFMHHHDDKHNEHTEYDGCE